MNATALQPLGRSASAIALAMAIATVALAYLASSTGIVQPNSETVELRQSPATVLAIATINLFQAAGAFFVASLALATRNPLLRRLAWVLVVLIPVRSALVVGIVGATDLSWLWGATRWWAFEYAAIALGTTAAVLLLRSQNPVALQPMARLAMPTIIVMLLLGAAIETYST